MALKKKTLKERFDYFQKLYDDDIKFINNCLYSDEYIEIKDFIKWVLTTECNLYGCLPGDFADLSAYNVAKLISQLDYCLKDDGDISFITVNNEPRIVFYSNNEPDFRRKALSIYEYQMEKENRFFYNIKILDIKISEFAPLYDKYFSDYVKQCFKTDTHQVGLYHSMMHYSQYDCFNIKWIEEAFTTKVI
jgi:hypothetical protein